MKVHLKSMLMGAVVGVCALASGTAAWASAYSGISVPGTLLAGNDWSPGAQALSDNGGLWTGSFQTKGTSGQFKFAANGGWDLSWGGAGVDYVITRLPATGLGPLTSANGRNITMNGVAAGETLTFAFDENTLMCDVVSATAPEVTSVQLAGTFNNWGNGTTVGTMAKVGDVWTTDVTLTEDASVQVIVNGDTAGKWGPPASWNLAPTPTNEPTAPMCGDSTAAVAVEKAGVFRFTFDPETLVLSATQTEEFTFAAVGMSADGTWVGAKGMGDGANLTPADVVYSGSFWVTNASGKEFTLLFSERSTNGTVGGLYYGYSTNVEMTAVSLSGSTNLTAVSAKSKGAVKPFRFKSTGPGMYVFTVDKAAMNVTAQRKYLASTGINMLTNNPSFEQMNDDGTPTEWTCYNARGTTVGYHAGKAAGYLSHDAAWPDTSIYYGSLSRDVAVASNHWGATYRLSAWFRELGAWSDKASVQLQIEWRDADGQKIRSSEQDVMKTTTWAWTYEVLESEVPEGTKTAHVVLNYSGAGEEGAMLVDDVELRVASARLQTFDTWGAREGLFGSYSPDWELSMGKTINNDHDLDLGEGGVFFAKYIEGRNNNKALEIHNASTNAVDLSQYALWFYMNGAQTGAARVTNAATTNGILVIPLSGTLAATNSFVISQTNNYFPINPAPEIIAASDMQTPWLTFNGDDVVVLMKGNQVVDRVGQVKSDVAHDFNSFVMRDHTLVRKAATSFGTATAVTADWPLWTEWEIEACDDFEGLGEHVRRPPDDVYVPSGLSLILQTNANVKTPALEGGVGDISFWYRAATTTNTTAGTIYVETSPDGVDWTIVGEVTVQATDTEWQAFSVTQNDPSASYVRLRSDAQSTGLVRIDEVMVGSALPVERHQDFTEWTAPSWSEYHGTYDHGGWRLVGQVTNGTSGLAALMRDGDSLTSPLFAEGGAGTVTFTPRGAGGKIQVYFSEDRVDWEACGSPVNVTTNGLRTNVAVNVSGKVAVKFVVSCDEDKSVTLDNIDVRIYEGSGGGTSREQPFDTWKKSSSYGECSGEGWVCSWGYVEDKAEFGSQVLRMGKNTGDTLTSPQMEGGIGILSFRAAAYSTSHTPSFTVSVATGPNGPWTVLKRYSLSADPNPQTYTISVMDKQYEYVQFKTTNNKLLVLDDINVGKYKEPGTVSLEAGVTPNPPPLDANFQFTGVAMPVGESTVVKAEMKYRTRIKGSWGATSTVLLEYDSGEGLYLSGKMPPYVEGTSLQYWLSVTWTTLVGTQVTTNVSVSATNETLFSAVSGGGVWINEIATQRTPDDPQGDDDFWSSGSQKHEFIELCGPAGEDIGGWKIVLMLTRQAEIDKNNGKSTYATYTIPQNTMLPRDVVVTNAGGKTAGYGFFVLGDNANGLVASNHPLSNVDMYFGTSYVPSAISGGDDDDHIHYQGMIQLKNAAGAVIDTLVYGRPYQGQSSVGRLYDDDSNSLGAAGTGYQAGDFDNEWAAGQPTVGELNAGQTLVVRPVTEKALPEGLFHEAGRLMHGGTAALANYYMIDTGDGQWPVDMRKAMAFIVAGPREVIDFGNVEGQLHLRHGVSGTFGKYALEFAEGYGDGSNYNAMRSAEFAAQTLQRLECVQYYFEVTADSDRYLPAYVAADAEDPDQYATYDNENDAMEHPFTFIVPFPDFADEDAMIEDFQVSVAGGTGTVSFYWNRSTAPRADEMALQWTTNLITGPWTELESEGTRTDEGEYAAFSYTFDLPATDGAWAVRLKPALQPDEPAGE